jgi:hypothetical protein
VNSPLVRVIASDLPLGHDDDEEFFAFDRAALI